MKILIVTFSFPPLNKIASSRPYSWAKYWSKMGHEVMVVTKKKTPRDGPLNFEIEEDDLKNVNVFELAAWPLWLKKPASDNSTFRHPTFSLSTLKYLKAGRFIFRGDYWLLPALNKINNIYQSFPFEIVISTYGPRGSHIIGSFIKKKYNVFWVADYRDLWSGKGKKHKKGLLDLIRDKIEIFFVSKADLITTVSEGLKKQLSNRFSCDVVKIENGFDENEICRKSIDGNIFNNDNIVRLVYTGTLYPRWQNASALFEALLILIKKGIQLEKYLEVLFYGSYLGELEILINRYNLKSVVRVKGIVSREESIEIQRSADALLFFEWCDPSAQGIITGKLFEYLFSGRPILSIGPGTDTETLSLIKDNYAGLILGESPQVIADSIEKLLNGKKIYYRVYRDNLERYNRKYLAEKMLKIIQKNISSDM